MIIYPLFSLITVLWANLNTAYHPHLKFKKHIKIKNPKLAKILINQRNPLKNTKAKQNKLLIAGLIFYILSLLVVIFSFVLIYIVPEIPMPLNESEANIDALYLYNTLNKKLTLTISCALASIEEIFRVINLFKYQEEESYCKKAVNVVTILHIFIVLCFFIDIVRTIFSDIITCCF